MIEDKELAKEVDLILRGVFSALDQSAALVRQRSNEGEVATYVAAVGKVFMCIYAEIVDPLYCDHPDLAPPLWNMDY